MRLSRRWFLAASVSALAISAPYTGKAAIGGIAPVSTGGGTTSLGTLTLVNNGGSTAAVGTVSPMFGWVFGGAAGNRDVPAIAFTTGDIASGSNLVHNVASTSGMANGQLVIIEGVPYGTTITNISGSTVTLSQNASATITGGKFTVPGAPQFLDGNSPQPYSWGMQRCRDSDGSLMFASFFFRQTFSLAASGTRAISVRSGGTQPTTTARTLAEVYAQGVSVSITAANNSGTPIAPANFSGTLGAWIANAGNNGPNVNNIKQSLTHIGDAGAVWRHACLMSPTIAGAADGQSSCDFLVMATTDAGGALGGIRLNPGLQRSWYNSTSGSANLIAIQSNASFSWTGGGGGSVDMVSAGTIPFSTLNFTVTVGQAATTAANNYWIGSTAGFIPVYVKNSGGALPTGLNANTLYYLQGNASNNNVTFYAMPGNYNSGIAVSGGSGTNTIVPVGAVQQYEPVWMARSDGRWNEFTGSGTGNTGTSVNLQVQFDRTYWHSTKVLPPYDLSLVGSVTDNNWPFNYTPCTAGPWVWNGGTGERPEIGVLPNEHAVHFFTQSAASDKLVRVGGYAGFNQGKHIRDAPVALGGGGTGQIPNLNNATYAGMPPFVASPVQYYDFNFNPFSSGINLPTDGFGMQDFGYDHLPHPFPYAYLLTGEPQYLDGVIDMAACALLQGPTKDNTSRNPTKPITTTGILTSLQTQPRAQAWALADLMWAATLVPSAHYDGSQLHKNLNDLVGNSFRYAVACLNPANDAYGNACQFNATISGTTLTMHGAPTYSILLEGQVITSGAAAGTTIVKQLSGQSGGADLATYQVSISQTVAVSTPMVSSSTSYITSNLGWIGVNADIFFMMFVIDYQTFYCMSAINLAVAALESTDAFTVLQSLGTRYSYLTSKIGGWCMYDHGGGSGTVGQFPPGINATWPPTSDDSQLGTSLERSAGGGSPMDNLNWSNVGFGGSPTTFFQWTNTDQIGSGFTPANNDAIIAFGGSAGAVIPSVMQFYTTYYAWDVQGNNVNFYTQKNGGGTKIVPVDAGSFGVTHAVFIAPANQTPIAASTGNQPIDGPGDAQSYVAGGCGAFAWALANGATNFGSQSNVNTPAGDALTRRNASSGYTNVDVFPKYAMQATF